MKHTKIAAAAVAAALMIPLAACNDAEPNENELVVQTVWTRGTNEGDALQRVFDQFTEETGVSVRWLDTGESMSDVYETSVAAGNQADIVIGNYVEKVVDWVSNGAVVPAEDYLTEWGLDETIRPEAVEEWRDSSGELVGLPYSGFTWPVWYNTDLLAEAGVEEIPTTTDELITAAGQLRDAGIAPMTIGGNDWSGQKLFLQIVQAYAEPEVAREVFSNGGFCENAEIFRGVELFTELRDAGVFIDDAQGYSADAMNTEYYTGNAAIMSAGSWAFGDLPEEIGSATTLSGFPNPEGGAYTQPTAMQGSTGSGVMVSENGAEKIELVEQFVQLLYAPESVEDFVSSANMVPASTNAEDAEVTDPMLQQAVSELDDRVEFAVMPDTAVPGAVADPMIRATSLAYSPDYDADAVCAEIDAAYATVG
ncbi:ABC transporter substrate-binding protein [Ruania alba]|uniref:Carbohydrate ABC transporter substrate-binding protein, CUT1 family n=1 Tax=Ruania alba TaxID=648782 RepID=A0A1H5KIM7_9MICO|nr:ABC transporter substrate-binding protein [Ruania alba]SEE64540.1 carbohydrate ABC transporter substrate-binding protein, CUT1 family [Ruania alba]